ncbi:Gfo/Idh/MocA family oxidoreductase [Candidatus Uhrbacteria bacterium]|nr:Gfo/Idh/MocA family oxidoreductase [Candidatus Uhrbacteria bacterium]
MLKFGFIGCGSAARSHADVVRALGHQIYAVAARANSLNIDSFVHDYRVSRKFSDWGEMLLHGRPDALIVATSWENTELVAKEIIQARLPVLIEKPLALSSRKIKDILAEVGEVQGRVMVGYNRRFYDFIPRLKEMIASHPLISVELNCPDSYRDNVKRHGEKLRENILLYKTSHWLDLLIYLLGRVQIVKMYRRSGGTPAYSGILESPGRIPIHFQANFDAPSQISLTLNFEGFICRLRPMEILRIYEGMRLVEETREVPYRRYEPELKEEQMTDFTYKPGFLNQIRHFIEACVEKKTEKSHGCSLQEALQVTELCETIRGRKDFGESLP